jgi:biopolymer transport protein ExbD
MSWLKNNGLAGLMNTKRNVAFLVVVTVVVTMISAAPRSSAQALQKGISVELARTSGAMPVPDADSENAVIVTVTDTGRLYLGINPVTPDSLAEKLKGRPSGTQTLYIKADAKAPYANVVKVLDAARVANVSAVTLLTTQPNATPAGAGVPPQGIEMEMARRSAARKN